MYFIINKKLGKVLGFNVGIGPNRRSKTSSSLEWVDEAYDPVEYDTHDDAVTTCMIISKLDKEIKMEDLEVKSWLLSPRSPEGLND